MRQTVLIYLHVTTRLQLINCFKRRTSHELNFNTRFQLPSSLRAFDAAYQGDSKFARETSKTQTAFIGSIFSDERNPPCLGADQKARGLWQRDWPF